MFPFVEYYVIIVSQLRYFAIKKGDNYMLLLPKERHPSWDLLLTDDFMSKLYEIETILEAMPVMNDYRYFPEKENIMRFMKQDLSKIKCIILGMEPYASWYENENGEIVPVATGRSFEIDNVYSWQQKFKQSSLRNILKTVYYNETGVIKSLDEIREEMSAGDFVMSSPHEWFDELEQSGVMFLNATLTVEPNKPDSHTKMWENVMNDIIKYIDSNADAKWLLFGNKAQSRIIYALGEQLNIYKCCHPRLAEFVNENIFAKIPEIDWVGKN